MVIDTLRKSISYGLLLISIVIYSAGNRTAGDYVFKGAVAALCISVIIALVSKTYKKDHKRNVAADNRIYLWY